MLSLYIYTLYITENYSTCLVLWFESCAQQQYQRNTKNKISEAMSTGNSSYRSTQKQKLK